MKTVTLSDEELDTLQDLVCDDIHKTRDILEDEISRMVETGARLSGITAQRLALHKYYLQMLLSISEKLT